MLDPLTAISLASAVVQFVDFSAKLVSAGHELYEKGSLANNDEIEQITQDLSQLADELGAQRPPSSKQLSQDEIALQQLAGSCKELADEMMAVLNPLKVQKSKNSLEVVRKSLRSMRKKGKIHNIEKRLDRIRDELSLRLTAILSKKQSGVSSLLQDLKDETERHHTTTDANLQLLQTQLLAILERQKKSSDRVEEFGNISSKCLDLAEEGKSVATAQKILKSLHFKTIKTRQVNVKEAHTNTFKWIFNDPKDSSKPRTRFKEWMGSESRSGIYWISGKAGSGKSTLMKFLIDHRVTLSTLELWSNGENLIIASHFFWSSGNSMQKSQEGLLQSLLFQILRKRPDLIQSCCLTRWESPDLYQDDPDPWSLVELSDCFARLAQDDRTPQLFLLIDGLDEYDGEHLELVQILQRMNGSPKIKMCVSSRPWNAFEDAFGSNAEQTLRLQDFTRGDITLYTKEHLEADERFLRLKRQDHRYLQLEKAIVDKAEGVFLWVYLVIRALLRGLTDDNDIDFLKERLGTLPAGLEDYFTKMLGTIESVYQEQTARIFQVMVHAADALPAVCLEFLAIEKKDPDYVLRAVPPLMTQDAIINVGNRMKKYVNARCKDLLEIHIMPKNASTNSLSYHVDFLHRSVRDFLATEDMQDLLGSRTGENFEARVSLCKMTLAEIKTICNVPQSPDTGFATFAELIFFFFHYVQMVERYLGICEVTLIDELHKVFRHFQSGLGENIMLTFPVYHYKNNGPIMALAVEANMHGYVKEKLSLQRQLITDDDDWTLLDHATTRPSLGFVKTYSIHEDGPFAEPLNLEMITLLLSHGIRPNRKDPETYRSTWDRFLQQCHEKKSPFFQHKQRVVVDIIKLFIEYGADTNVEVATDVNPKKHSTKGRWGRQRSIKLPIPMREILEATFTPAQVAEIDGVIARKNQSFIWKWIGWE